MPDPCPRSITTRSNTSSTLPPAHTVLRFHRWHYVDAHGLGLVSDSLNQRPASTSPCCATTPANVSGCPIYRGEIAQVPGRDEMYVWYVNSADPLRQTVAFTRPKTAARRGRRSTSLASIIAATPAGAALRKATTTSPVGSPERRHRNRCLCRRGQYFPLPGERFGLDLQQHHTCVWLHAGGIVFQSASGPARVRLPAFESKHRLFRE